MKNTDAILHTKGESIYIDDITTGSDVLYAGIFSSPIAHGKIKKLNVEGALCCEGVVDIITAEDIPGENQIGGIIPDETLLPEDSVHYIGEPVAIVIAETKKLAIAAFDKIELEMDLLPVITDPREAFEKGELIDAPHTFLMGDISSAWDDCDIIVDGTVESGAQEHFYLESQGAIAYPVEQNRIKIISSTQSPTSVQRATANVLGMGMHEVEVDVRRLGGGFGGKEDQATMWAALAALSAYKVKRSVKLTLNRHEDIVMTGKRHPYSSDYKIGLSSDGKILAYEVMFYQNAGACADLSTAILHRTLFHCTNTYNIPNVKATAAPCRTNLHPFTAFRGFGGPQGMLVIETAILKAAQKMGIDPMDIQEKNLLNEGDSFPYGMKIENCKAGECFSQAMDRFNVNKLYEEVNEFNSNNNMYKKGVSLMPICFGISFTATFLNQARSLVHVYTDGSVSINTAAIEMGQGVNMKILQIAARTFSINQDRLRIESTNTSRVSNTSPTAASASADLNGEAARLACEDILSRLRKVASDYLDHSNSDDISIKDETVYCKNEKTDLTWETLVNEAYFSRVNLSSHAHYATPDLYFDNKMEKGKPFAYHVFGTAVTEVTLNCLKGTFEIDRVNILHDAGQSLNELIDMGQVQGALLQGIGWLTIEDLQYDENGRLLTDSASSIKIPDIKFIPGKVDVKFLENSNNPRAVFNSKAVGEPPFMYGIGTIIALEKAIREFTQKNRGTLIAPLTPERILGCLYGA